MYKAYKYRIYPNKQQKELIRKTFGCCRFVYNQTLAYKKELYEKEKKSVSKIDCNNYCNRELKKTYEWLKEVDKFALTNAIYNMDSAYQKFFKEHAGYPKFKSKRNHKKSYTTTINGKNIEVSFEKKKIKLPKLKWIKAKLSREFAGKIKSATVSQTPSGKYFVSILVDAEHVPMESADGIIGIDLGTTFSVVAIYKDDGVEIIPNEIDKRTTPSVVSYYNNTDIIVQGLKRVGGEKLSSDAFTWSSSEGYIDKIAWASNFLTGNGLSDGYTKRTSFEVRPVLEF